MTITAELDLAEARRPQDGVCSVAARPLRPAAHPGRCARPSH
jgi:hypothetical protein